MSRTLRIGIFTLVGVLFIVGFSVYVNDHPYWYRSCNEVKIHVDDATGLRMKSPVKTLGLEIGYISNVGLDGDKVLIKVCVTGPVKLSPDTRAYIRSAGFLGDKFLELKPVDMTDGTPTRPRSVAPAKDEKKDSTSPDAEPNQDAIKNSSSAPKQSDDAIPLPIENENESKNSKPFPIEILSWMSEQLIPSAHAEEPTLNASREAELQDTVKKVGKLIDQLTLMVGDLREVTQQKDFKETIINLNGAMKHLEGLLRPGSKTMKNVDAALESLKNTMASAEEVMNKVKKGEGTLGKFMTDPSVYEETKAAIKSINLLLGKAGSLRTYVDLNAINVKAYDGYKARFTITIAPSPDRYYLLGITSDPRGRDKKTTTSTQVNGGSVMTEVKTVNEEKGLRITAMFGKYFGPLDLAVGLIEDGGGASAAFWLDEEHKMGVKAEMYSGAKAEPMRLRLSAKAHLYSGLYVTGGVDDIKNYNNKIPYFVGAGLFFDDEDLRYLLAFK